MAEREDAMTMGEIVREFRARGFRVLNGHWPKTLAAEKRWDFCYAGGSIFSMNSKATEAMNDLCHRRGLGCLGPGLLRPGGLGVRGGGSKTRRGGAYHRRR
jgi:hypothetical protein